MQIEFFNSQKFICREASSSVFNCFLNEALWWTDNWIGILEKQSEKNFWEKKTKFKLSPTELPQGQ